MRKALLLAGVVLAGCAAPHRPPASGGPLDAVAFSVAADRIPHADGLAVDRYDNLYVTSSDSHGSVIRISPDGRRETLTEGLGRAGSLCFADDGDLFVASGSSKVGIWRVRPDGVRSIAVAGMAIPAGLGADKRGRLFIAEARSGGRILRYTAGEWLVWVPALNRPEGVAVDEQSNLYVAEAGEERLLRFGPDGRSHPLVPPGILRHPGMLCYAPRYAGLFVAESRTDGRLWFVGRDGVAKVLLHGLRHPQGIAVNAAGDCFLAERGRDRILRIEAAALAFALADGP